MAINEDMDVGKAELLRASRSGTREDFRGSSWGAGNMQVLESEVENLREDWSGNSRLFGLGVTFRYSFGPAGLRGGTYEFELQGDYSDPSVAFRHVLAELMKQYSVPLYLQQTPAVLGADVELPPMSLLRSMAKGSPRCIAAWAIDASELLLIKDDTAVPLRLLCNARAGSLYPDANPRADTSQPVQQAAPLTAKQSAQVVSITFNPVGECARAGASRAEPQRRQPVEVPNAAALLHALLR